MFSINENVDCDDMLARHNIRISELKKEENMSQPNVKKVIHLPKVRMLGRGRPSSGIRITNVKSIKPPDPEIAKKYEEDKLRKKLHKEIERRSRVCANKSYDCTLPVVLGRQYCGVHILQDPTAPYRQCSHTYSNEKRCPLPAPLTHHDRRDQGLCFEHARSALAARQRAAAPPPPVTTTETLLNQLTHYVRPERVRTTSCASSVSVVSDPADLDQGIPAPVDPFKQIDAIGVNRACSGALMECASATDSDADSVTLGRDGDCRLAHAQAHAPRLQDDAPLRHAGVFTAEEAVGEAHSSLRRLRAAYVRQLRRLRVLLRQARLRYVRELRAERDLSCSINSQSRGGPLTVKERRQLRKLKCYASYHRRLGVDAVLARKLHRKRAKVNDVLSHRPIPSLGRCTYTEYGARCPAAALPASRHCLKHVVLDRHQVLFTTCGDARGGVACRETVARPPLPALCRYHTDPPSHTVFTLKKENSDSDSETASASTDSATEEAGSHSVDEPSDIHENNVAHDL